MSAVRAATILAATLPLALLPLRPAAGDEPEPDTKLALEETAALIAVGGKWPGPLSPFAGKLGPTAEAPDQETTQNLQRAGLLDEAGRFTSRGRELWQALVTPVLTYHVRRTAKDSTGIAWYLAHGEHIWCWLPAGDSDARIMGPLVRGAAPSLLAQRSPLPTPTKSPDIAATFSLHEFMTLQCIAREQRMFSALVGREDDGLGLTLDEIANYIFSPTRVDVLASDASFDLMQYWDGLSEPAKVQSVVDTLGEQGWVVSKRSIRSVRYRLSERAELLARTVFNPAQRLQVSCLRSIAGRVRRTTLVFCSSSEGLVLVRTDPGSHEFTITPLPPGDPAAAQADAIAGLLPKPAPAAPPPGRAATQPAAREVPQPAPTSTGLPGDEIRAELERSVYRTAAAQTRRELWGRGKTDTWAVDTNGDGHGDVEYEDTDGDGEPDFVRVRDFPERPFTRSFIHADGHWQESNILEAFLEIKYQLPWQRNAYHKHSVDIILNDQLVARLTDVIPEGLYRFRVPPRALRVDANSPQENDVRLETTHLRGGHYVVSTDFKLILHMSQISRHIIADNPDDAQRILVEEGNLITSGVDLAVYVNEWHVEPPVPKDGREANIRGVVHNDGEDQAVGWKVRFYHGDPADGGTLFAEHALDPLEKGTSVGVAGKWTARAGEHRLYALLTPPEGAADLREDNNQISLTVRGGGDSEPPTLTISEPADNAELVGSTLTLRGTAADNVGLAALEYSVDGGLWQTAVVGERWELQIELRQGKRSIRVRLRDTSGLEKTVVRTVRVR